MRQSFDKKPVSKSGAGGWTIKSNLSLSSTLGFQKRKKRKSGKRSLEKE